MKEFTRVNAGTLAIPAAQKTTIVNTGIGPIFLTPTESNDALEVLEYEESLIVKKALFAIQEGQSKVVPAGTYEIDFDNKPNASAVLFVEINQSKKPASTKDSVQP